MARYSKHYVSFGDTIQGVAHTSTGDVSNWREIVRYNNLRYPCIVDTVAEKMENPEQLVTVGDHLIIPFESELSDFNPQALNIGDRDTVTDLVLGIDLDIGTENFHLEADSKGDLAVVRGHENLKQAIIMNLLTPRGTLLLHPEYGSNIHEMFGKATAQNAIIIENDIVSTIKTDTRVVRVNVISSSISEDTYTGEFSVQVNSDEENFKLLVKTDTIGNLNIR